MICLDHTAYPFLMDEVIKYASVQALSKLRLTSKAFRARADRVLGSHVVLEATGGEEEMKTAMHLPRTRRFTPGPSTWEMTVPQSSVRVLDVDRRLLRDAKLAPAFNAFTNVTTVRRFWGADGNENGPSLHPTSAHTIVDFVPTTQRRNISLSPAHRHTIHLGPIDPTATRTLFHKSNNAPLKDIVLVLWPLPINQTGEVAHPTKCSFRRSAEDWAKEMTSARLAEMCHKLSVVLSAVTTILFAAPRQCTVVWFEHLDTSPHSSEASVASPMRDTHYESLVRMSKKLPGNLPKPVALRVLKGDEWLAELEAAGEKDLIGVWPAEYYDSVSGSRRVALIPVACRLGGVRTCIRHHALDMYECSFLEAGVSQPGVNLDTGLLAGSVTERCG